MRCATKHSRWPASVKPCFLWCTPKSLPAALPVCRLRSEVAKFCQKYLAGEITRLEKYHEGNLPDSLVEVRMPCGALPPPSGTSMPPLTMAFRTILPSDVHTQSAQSPWERWMTYPLHGQDGPWQ